MTAVSEAEVEGALAQVLDPCSIALGRPLDLLSMGLVDDISIDNDNVRVTVVLTDSACAFYQDMRQHICDAVGQVAGVTDVDVSISMSKLWSPARLDSSRGKRALLPLHVEGGTA